MCGPQSPRLRSKLTRTCLGILLARPCLWAFRVPLQYATFRGPYAFPKPSRIWNLSYTGGDSKIRIQSETSEQLSCCTVIMTLRHENGSSRANLGLDRLSRVLVTPRAGCTSRLSKQHFSLEFQIQRLANRLIEFLYCRLLGEQHRGAGVLHRHLVLAPGLHRHADDDDI